MRPVVTTWSTAAAFLRQRFVQVAQRRQQRTVHGQISAEVNGRGNYVVAALPHVDVIVGVYLAVDLIAGQPRNHLVGVHIGARARPRLKNVQGEVLVVLPCGHGLGRCFDGLGHVGLHQAQIAIDGRCRAFD